MSIADPHHDALMAVAGALTGAEAAAVRAFAGPSFEGAEPADWIAEADNADAYLDRIEPFFEEHGERLPGVTGTRFVLYVLIALDLPLTVANVVKFLLRAKLMPKAESVLIWEPYGSNAVYHPCSWAARGTEFTYLVMRTVHGRLLLARWSREEDRLPELNDSRTHEALETAIDVSTLDEGRRLADRYEQGEDLEWAAAWCRPGKPAMRVS